jgi:methylamine---glutamate N-methyltransferase subunit C
MTQTPSGMRGTDQAAARKARLGREALFPFDHETHFGRAALGADQIAPLPYPGFESLLIAPPLFTPKRYERLLELGREPIHLDVDTRVRMGPFVSASPITVAALGSTQLANRHAVSIARAAGRAGVVMSIGENVATMRGYAKRLQENESCLKERILGYLEAAPQDVGGLLIQQSVEDADAELWNRVYSDPDLEPYFRDGRLGFEIKAGQGAKPGLGGEVRVGREEALSLVDRFKFGEDPREHERPFYDRHAAAGTFSPAILENMIRLLRNNYPRAVVGLKLGSFRDLGEVIPVAARAGAHIITLDGHAGGTGMAPILSLSHLGVPTLSCLAQAAHAKRSGLEPTVLVSGGLSGGEDAVKALAAGAGGIALGRVFLSAAEAAGEEGVERFLAVLKEEVQLAASSLGKYHLEDLESEDLVALHPEIARMLGVPYAFAAPAPGASPVTTPSLVPSPPAPDASPESH